MNRDIIPMENVDPYKVAIDSFAAGESAPIPAPRTMPTEIVVPRGPEYKTVSGFIRSLPGVMVTTGVVLTIALWLALRMAGLI